jgi:hypothetical protein
MRLLPLVGLVGLTGLAAASPVIGLGAGKDASVTPPRRLVVYTHVNFTGTPYKIHAEKVCAQFVAPVYKNLQSFKVADQVCYFMDEDACGGKALVIVDALGAEAWANTDDGTIFSSLITSVYCEDHSKRPPGGADAAVVKRDGPGETTVCRSTMDIGPCVTLSANSACVFFGYELRHNIRHVYQAYGSICNYYYDSNCDVPTPVMTVNTHEQALHVPLDKQTGDRLAYVKCQDQWSAQDIKDDTVHIFHRADGVHHSIGEATDVVQTRSTTATLCDDPRYVDPDANVGPGYVYFCWGRKEGTERGNNCNRNCLGKYANNICFNLPQWWPGLVDSLWQPPGFVCKYYRKDCLDKWPSLIIDTRTLPFPSQDFKKNGIFVSSVVNKSYRDLGELGVGPDTIVYNGTSSAPAQLKQEATGIVFRTKDTALKNIEVTVCAGPDVTGGCIHVDAEFCWVMLPKSAASLRQSEGLVCTLWSTQDCKGNSWSLTTDFTYKATNVPPEITDRALSISCDSVDAQPAPEANTEQLQPTKKREEFLPLGSAGQVLVADREGFGGKTQLVDTVKDDNNCAPLFNQFFWNLQSLIQYRGSVCTYWQYDCGDLLPDNKPVFTVDSLGGQIGLSPIPYVFGGENRNKIAYIRCINGKAAADYMAALGPSEKVIDIETSGVAKNTPFSTGPHDGQLAARAESTTEDYFEPLILYHDPDKGGAVMTYVGPSCGLNPFNVDPIKSLWQDKGFLCQFYPEWGCQETKGPPLWIDSKDGPCYNRNVEFPILSISCTRSTYEDATQRPDTTQLIEYKAEATPAALTSGTITPATLATRTDAANTFTPLKFCTGENLTGACFSYTGPACASGDPAIFEMKSLVVDKDFQCVFMSGLNCNEGYPHYVDARQDENRINSIDWIVKSIYCKPEPWHG